MGFLAHQCLLMWRKKATDQNWHAFGMLRGESSQTGGDPMSERFDVMKKNSKKASRLFAGVLMTAVALSLLFLAGCNCDTGSCYSVGGDWGDECSGGWTEEECADFDSRGVNGASWYFSCRACNDVCPSCTCSFSCN